MNWQPDLYTVCLTGFGASALGLAGLVARPSRAARRGLVWLVLAPAAVARGAAAAPAGLPQASWAPPAALSAVWLPFAAVRSPAAAAAAPRGFPLGPRRPAPAASLPLPGP